jgi:hypothetical protein
MLARSELAEYVADTYGTCDRDRPGRNDCYWGKDGCLKTGWRGRGCPHWHPVEGADFDKLMAALTPR